MTIQERHEIINNLVMAYGYDYQNMLDMEEGPVADVITLLGTDAIFLDNGDVLYQENGNVFVSTNEGLFFHGVQK